MGFLKAFTLITLWILLSFFWVSMGQTKEKECLNYGNVESWLKPHPVVMDWYRFYASRHACIYDEADFFKALASSEQLSTKLNQARVTFDQFYVPVSHLIGVDWKMVRDGSAQGIQSDLTQINHSLDKTLSKMNSAEQDYFRSIVLLDLPTQFAGMKGDATHQELMVSRRINKGSPGSLKKIEVDNREVVPPPYQPAYRIFPGNTLTRVKTLNLC
ncbi:MAG: hypothetical protein Q7T03_00070 [Deltaproteobacteria bacterium]|nr:hypothetical protein [Deltaproteobacteria bacterium]